MKLKLWRPVVIIPAAVALVILIVVLVFVLGDFQLDIFSKPEPKLSGWQTIDDTIYYFDPETGEKHTGWLELPEGKYFMNDDGVQVIGLFPCPQGIYYFDELGLLVTGWADTADGKRYFTEDGTMAVGLLEIDGKQYCFNQYGIVHIGWLHTEETSYYFLEDGTAAVGFLELEKKSYYFGEGGIMYQGWLNWEGKHLYFDETGALVTTPGWLRTAEGTWYLKEDGQPYTGWLQNSEARYYFLEDGAMAVGPVLIDKVWRYFSSDGNYVPLINPWNKVPADFKLNLVTLEGHQVDSTCYDELKAMIAAARNAGLTCVLDSTYRTMSTQTYLWDWRYNDYLQQGYSAEEAYRLTARRVAYPGTSEHHTGLAMDIVEVIKDGSLYQWFKEHAWEYGFVVRYVGEKEPLTGIKDEPWHLRYVGKEIAQVMQETGWCLEEFITQATPASE